MDLTKKLIFICGKGGVGKTSVSKALALTLSKKGLKTLWVAFEDPLKPPGELLEISPTLWHLNCESITAFEEYVGLKIGVPSLTKIFLQNKLMRYMAKAAPGIHDLVLLGKIWFERKNYDHIVLDMPSTGYGLAMFQGTENFSKLFQGGPTHRDALSMLETFGDPSETHFLIVTLPEEMPIRESLELNGYLQKMFPKNPASFLVNRSFPKPVTAPAASQSPESWIGASPIPQSALDYVEKRSINEAYNLRLLEQEKIEFTELGFLLPTEDKDLIHTLSEEIENHVILH